MVMVNFVRMASILKKKKRRKERKKENRKKFNFYKQSVYLLKLWYIDAGKQRPEADVKKQWNTFNRVF